MIYFYRLWITTGLLLATFVQFAHGWDSEGHRVVARIAAMLLKLRKTRRFIVDHLPPRPASSLKSVESRLVEAASWADSQVETKDLHYSFTPYRGCRPFDIAKDCGVDKSGRCVVTGIDDAMRNACDYSVDASVRRDALRLLIHIFADAHQPLHTGFEEDWGGNHIPVASPADISLHAFWDGCLMGEQKTRKGESWYQMADRLSQILKTDSSLRDSFLIPDMAVDNGIAFASVIVSETAVELTCRVAYQNERGAFIEPMEDLSEDYTSRGIGAMELQFMKAGVRLAQALDILADAFYRAESAAVFASTTVSVDGASSSANRFASLIPITFDPEEVLFTAEEIPLCDDEAPIEVAVEAKPAASKKRSGGRKQVKPPRATRVEGLLIDYLVLIKRGSSYYITQSHNVKSESFVPARTDPAIFRFAGRSEPSVFNLDLDVFKSSHYTFETMATLFRVLSGNPNGELVIGPDSLEASEVAAAFQTDPSTFKMPFVPREPSDPGFGKWCTRGSMGQILSEVHLAHVKATDEIADRMVTLPTPDEIAAWRGDRPPSRSDVTNMLLERQGDELLVYELARSPYVFITTFALAKSDLASNRFVYAFQEVGGYRGRDSTFNLVDTRLASTWFDYSCQKTLEHFVSRPSHMKRMQEFLKGYESPFYSISKLFAELIGAGFGQIGRKSLINYVSKLQSVKMVDNPNGPELLEFILRSPAQTLSVQEALSPCS